MWGQEFTKRSNDRLRGIIPTRVGTSCKSTRTEQTLRDHPHACGDKRVSASIFNRRQGSSPRVWGQVDIAVNTADRPRIIPTRVGTRATCIVFSRSIKDHPHACGDKSPFRNPLAVCQGSSPRVWGQVSDTNLLPYKERIIPTRVGTSTR